MSFSVVAPTGGVAGVAEPAVPTALSCPHLRSERRKRLGRSPAFRQPGHRHALGRILRLLHRRLALGAAGGVAWAERPTANAAATKLPAITRFMWISSWDCWCSVCIDLLRCAHSNSTPVDPACSAPLASCEGEPLVRAGALESPQVARRMQGSDQSPVDTGAAVRTSFDWIRIRRRFTYLRPGRSRSPTSRHRDSRMGYNRSPARKWRNWQTRRT